MFGRVLVVLVLVMLGIAGYTGYQALQVKDGLETVASEAAPAVQDLEDGDAASLRQRLGKVQDGAAQAADNSKGPGWWIASRLPKYGDDVQAIRTVADASDVLASDVLPRVVKGTTTVASVDPYDGPDAVRQVKRAARTLVRADKRLRHQESRVAAIDTEQLDPRLADPVEQLQVALGTATDYLDGKLGEAKQALAAVPSLP
ncbi:MAG TPA: hypothetical protein VF165_19980 [Nocardioidaceae bacterium]